MFNDLRYALRQLRKAPGFTAVVVLSLAFGIAANTVVFSSIQASFLDPLPGVEHGARLMVIDPRDRSGTYHLTSWLDYRDVREQQTSFREVAASSIRALNLSGADGHNERIWAELVSDNFFPLLGLRPALGRFFTADEATHPGSSPVAVIAYSYWQTRFGGSPTALGQTLRLNDIVFTIIGVAPEKFKGSVVALGFDVWMPWTMVGQLFPSSRELTARDDRPLMLLADLKPGITADQAHAELEAISRRLAAAYPGTNADLTPVLLPLWRSPFGAQPYLLGALATQQILVFLVLLVVCANTANLLLARASVRQKEIGIRLALGAGQFRIIRQLLTESVLLALLGALGGVLLSLWGIDALHHVPMPGNLPIKVVSHLDAAGCAFSALLGLVCGLLFGLAPALQLTRTDVNPTLKVGGHGAGAAPRHRLRNLLVAAEVTIALIVLVLAGLFLKSFHNAQTTDPGFDTRHVLLGSFDLAANGYDRPAARAFLREVLPRLQATPGVAAATAATFVPLDVRGMRKAPFAIVGQAAPAGRPEVALYGYVAPGYFQTMGIPLVDGVDFVALDNNDRPAEVIVNEEFARRYWPGLSPLGRKIVTGDSTYEVVGVARNCQCVSLSAQPAPLLYFSLRNRFSFDLTLQVRTRGEPLAFAPEVRRVVRELDPNLPLRDVSTLTQSIAESLVVIRIPALMLSVLGPLALLLAAIGIYSVLSYSVAQRTHEIGVRLALGASPRNVVALIVRQSIAVVAPGFVVGLGAVYLASFYLSRILVKVSPGDPTVFLAVPSLLLAVAWLACWLPARRAARVDPMIALRAE
ncbi:MAG TPA: ABC transporter permease [Opitutaceae bacterium]|nr:ABC transporter permease [Opitutaceae bacterium]